MYAKGFQFHKVRLKDNSYLNEKILILFQFHKVRLKEGLYVSNGRFNLFQFHKVRLKVFFHSIIKMVVRRFNSIRYD